MKWTRGSSWVDGAMGGLIFVLIILLIGIAAQGRPLLGSAPADFQTTLQDAGHDLQSAGRNVADSIRRVFQ